jgi:formylglycine-generating enzyme required for sulfatase activity
MYPLAGLPHRIILTVAAGAASMAFAPSSGFTPPGTTPVQVDGKTLYVDCNEVRNADWAEYLNYLRNTNGAGSDQYRQALPDSGTWNTVYGGGIPKLNDAYAELPVVGIGFLQAQQYCQWRSDRVREKYGKAVTYRLPTEAEWEKVRDQAVQVPAEKGLHKAGNGNAIHHLADNVSEMTGQQGTAMGMNWSLLETGADLGKGSAVHYTAPANWLGFRCVAEVD